MQTSISDATTPTADLSNCHVNPSVDQPAVRIATAADLPFVLDLQNRHANALGFLPRVALDWYISNGEVRITCDAGQHAGYILGRRHLRSARHVRPLFQTAICFDAQRRGLGLQLVETAAVEATAAGQTMLQAWCRVDLDANSFWKAAGFIAVGIRRPDTCRALPLILWRRPLTAAVDRRLTIVPRSAGWRASTAAPHRLLTAADRRLYLPPSGPTAD